MKGNGEEVPLCAAAVAGVTLPSFSCPLKRHKPERVRLKVGGGVEADVSLPGATVTSLHLMSLCSSRNPH